MKLRRATLADLPAIEEIYDHYVLTSDCTLQTESGTLEERRAWFESAIEVLVVEEGEAVVGWGALVPYSTRGGYRWTVEDSVYLRRDARGRGIGKTLLRELIARARERGLHSIVAKIAATQAGSLRLHEQLGFVEVGRIKEAGFKFDQWIDVAFLQLRV